MYLLPDLKYPVDDYPSQFTNAQVIGVAASAYFCSLMFALLLSFTLYNTWMYLIKQGKWRVFSLSMFYALTILCLVIRIIVNVMTEYIALMFSCALVIFPAVIKICIGVVQIAVMIEITMRVKESLNTLNAINKRNRLQAKNFMNNVMASQKRSDRCVLVLQICVFIFTISMLSWTLTMAVMKDIENSANSDA